MARSSSGRSSGPISATIEVDGVDQLAAAMAHAPKELRRGLTKAMRKAAIPAKLTADATVAWSDGVRIRAQQSGAAVGSSGVVPPIIEFGNKAVVTGSAGVQAPHVRKLDRQPALIEAVESQLHHAQDIATYELELVLEKVLAQNRVLRG